jgi:hypothetical protein
MVLESHQFKLRICLGAQGGSQISSRREDFGGRSTDLPMLSKDLEIELSDYEAENGNLKSDYMWQVLKIVIGGVPTILEIGVVCCFMSLGRILW